MTKFFRSFLLNTSSNGLQKPATTSLTSRFICISSCLSRRNVTREEKMCEFNKTQYLHRNDTFKGKRVFYRGDKKVDYTMGQPTQKQTPIFSSHKKIEDQAVDDIYFIKDYKPKMYSLEESISYLQEIAELDFIDDNSLIQLRIRMNPLQAASKRKKGNFRPHMFLNNTEVPFPFDYKNIVGVFTSQEHIEQLSLENGAAHAGGVLFIRQVLNNSVKCDSYLCMDNYGHIVSDHVELKAKLGSYLPVRGRGYTNEEEILSTLKSRCIGVQYDNYINNGEMSLTRVGCLKQPVDEVAANIRHIIQMFKKEESTRQQKASTEFITGVSVLCCTEDVPIRLETC